MQRALSLIALALAACATVPPASARPTAGLGQSARISDVAVRPISLIEDSRCPARVQCIWAGRVRILAQISAHGKRATRREMILGEPIAIDQGKLMLIAAEPAKIAPGSTNPRAYRFTFRIDR